ncbi:MAG: hypothetical protein AABY49_13610 [Planctomycetota bacterium]
MKMNTFSMTIVAFVILVTLSGCMSIKDTSGIKQYLQDQGRAEIQAVDIKNKNPDKNSPAYKNAETLFNTAAGAGNGWTKGIVFDVKTKREVNISVQDYKDSDAGRSIAAFLSLEPEVTIKAFDPVTATVIATFVMSVIDLIQKQNDKQVEAASHAIEEEFSKARWTTFELTTPQWVNERYKLPSSGK